MLFNPEKIHTILVLMIDRHLGNLVVSLSSIKALIEYFQDKDVYLAIDSAYGEVAENIYDADRIIHYPRREIYGSNLFKRTILYLGFVKKLRGTHFDALIDLQGGDASSKVALLSGAEYRLSNSSARRSYIYNNKVDLPVGKHKVHSYTQIATAVGATINDTYYRLPTSEHRRTSLNHILKLQGITPDRPIISIHVGAGNIHKQWTTDGFAEVTEWLSAEGFQAVFVGADRDIDKINAVLSLLSHKSYSLGGLLSLGELMALFEMSSLFLGNDSGPMHLASAIGTPVVALFGPVDARRWRPLSPNSIVLRGQEPCENCRLIRKDCVHFECITQLSPETVKQAIDRLLNR